MKATQLFSLLAFTGLLAACSNPSVPVAKGADVNQVAPPNSQTTDKQIHFSESNVNGELSNQQTPAAAPQNVVYIPEKATAVCNDGTFSMAALNEACLNNGGIRTAISRNYAD